MKKSKPSLLRSLKSYIAAVLFGCAAAVTALVLFSLVIMLLGLTEFAYILSLTSFGTGCMVSGIIIGRVKRKNGLFKGIATGGMLLLLCACASIITGSFTGNELLIKLIVAVITGGTGGVIGVNRVKSVY